jgi:hypothetical protein
MFSKKVQLRVINEFPPKSDVAEVLAFVKAQRVPGELVVSLPGNGGVAAIVFKEKEKLHRGETVNNGKMD